VWKPHSRGNRLGGRRAHRHSATSYVVARLPRAEAEDAEWRVSRRGWLRGASHGSAQPLREADCHIRVSCGAARITPTKHASSPDSKRRQRSRRGVDPSLPQVRPAIGRHGTHQRRGRHAAAARDEQEPRLHPGNRDALREPHGSGEPRILQRAGRASRLHAVAAARLPHTGRPAEGGGRPAGGNPGSGCSRSSCWPCRPHRSPPAEGTAATSSDSISSRKRPHRRRGFDEASAG
jgi:hypothetical protein